MSEPSTGVPHPPNPPAEVGETNLRNRGTDPRERITNPYREVGGHTYEHHLHNAFNEGWAAREAALPDEAIRADERERLSARVYENGWCPTCGTKTADPGVIPGPDPGACPACGGWRKAGMIHRCPPVNEPETDT